MSEQNRDTLINAVLAAVTYCTKNTVGTPNPSPVALNNLVRAEDALWQFDNPPPVAEGDPVYVLTGGEWVLGKVTTVRYCRRFEPAWDIRTEPSAAGSQWRTPAALAEECRSQIREAQKTLNAIQAEPPAEPPAYKFDLWYNGVEKPIGLLCIFPDGRTSSMVPLNCPMVVEQFIDRVTHIAKEDGPSTAADFCQGYHWPVVAFRAQGAESVDE